MMKYSRKNQLKQADMQENEVQNKRRESEAPKMHTWQDKMSKTESQRGEMMIKNTQDKKENAKNESMLSEQYIHKKNIIETQSQSGRSMVEMLGVLAIIGVLSIGGIAGYKYAMNYYQANQIAHEINLMRTDAQVKIAQGAEELVLGNPYDDGNINFNNYETDFDCVYMETENATPDPAFCTAANAYYIEMKNIPEGVCRPLANLIDKMDNEIAFYINGKSVDAEAEGEKGACNEEPNTLRVIFGADSDSDAIKCDDDTNCPPELPVCFNHMCVECTQEKGCEGKSQYCKDNICKTCESGVWNGEKCVECTDNDDCENPTPICNENTCVACGNNDECRLKNSSEENCVAGGACCQDSRMTWKNNECVCPEDQPWNGESCGCKSNDDCKSDEFCLTSECQYYECFNYEKDEDPYHASTITEEKACADMPHKCVKVSEYTAPNLDSTSSPYVLSNQGMNWWSAKRFCQALPGSKHMLKISDDLDCCDSFSRTDYGYCYAKQDTCSYANGLSHVIKALRKAETGNEERGIGVYWLEDPWGIDPGPDSCAVNIIRLDDGMVTNNNRGNAHIDGGQRYALCK